MYYFEGHVEIFLISCFHFLTPLYYAFIGLI